jgi:gas vesicle protein
MTHRHDDDNGLVTFLFGVIVGAGVALLFAPVSGKETRRWLGEVDPGAIRGRVNDAIDDVSEIVGRGVDAYKKAAAETKA